MPATARIVCLVLGTCCAAGTARATSITSFPNTVGSPGQITLHGVTLTGEALGPIEATAKFHGGESAATCIWSGDECVSPGNFSLTLYRVTWGSDPFWMVKNLRTGGGELTSLVINALVGRAAFEACQSRDERDRLGARYDDDRRNPPDRDSGTCRESVRAEGGTRGIVALGLYSEPLQYGTGGLWGQLDLSFHGKPFAGGRAFAFSAELVQDDPPESAPEPAAVVMAGIAIVTGYALNKRKRSYKTIN